MKKVCRRVVPCFGTVQVRVYLNYYRLREVDTSGESKLGQIVRIQSANRQQLFLYSNPFTDHISLGLYRPSEQKLRISLLSLGGRSLRAWDYPAGTQAIKLEITAQLPKGIYILDIKAGGQHFTSKLLHE
jgi:hypothetical protein